jgi:hypothetical protein
MDERGGSPSDRGFPKAGSPATRPNEPTENDNNAERKTQ